MVSDRLFDRACEELQAQTKKVFELTQMHNALLARHNALVEAVAWLLEVQGVVDDNIMCPNWRRHVGISDMARKARAEVDRILMEPTP